MTKDEYRYLLDLKGLDDIGQGMLAPSVAVRRPEVVRDRLLWRGYIYREHDVTVIGPVIFPAVYLSTKGLRALQREARRRQMS